jgi:hypothetical protein
MKATVISTAEIEEGHWAPPSFVSDVKRRYISFLFCSRTRRLYHLVQDGDITRRLFAYDQVVVAHLACKPPLASTSSFFFARQYHYT